LQERIGYLLKRPVGRPSLDVRPLLRELYPCVGFIITNMARPPENVVAFYNKRGTCEQWIKDDTASICAKEYDICIGSIRRVSLSPWMPPALSLNYRPEVASLSG
jgi:hypothetical protein